MTNTELMPHRAHEPIIPHRAMQAPMRFETSEQMTHLTEREHDGLNQHARALQSAKTELARVEREQDAPADLLAYWREEVRIAQDEFDMEWAACEALQELRSGEAPLAITPEPEKPRCEFYRVIRQFYATAQGAGLNVQAGARMRQALSCLLNRPIGSRRELSAYDWSRAASAVASGELIW